MPVILINLNIKDYKFGIDTGKAILLHILQDYFCMKQYFVATFTSLPPFWIWKLQ